jgi:peroxiredoxin
MKTRFLTVAVMCCVCLTSALFAQAPAKKDEKKAPPPKTPADLAYDDFQKTRGDPASRAGQAGFQKLIAAGIAYLTQYPTHGQVNRVVNDLGMFANTSIDAKQAALRASFVSLLKLEIASQRYKDGVTDPAKAALAALDAAVADSELRINANNRESWTTLREKLDTLAETPGGARFMTDRERSYAHLLQLTNQTPRAEEQLKKLAQHPDKGVSDMAKQELNTIEVKKAPYALKFTALDGKEVDFAQLRGKVVGLYFWSSTNGNSTKEFEGLKQLHSDYKKRGFEVVTVSYDKEEDREKLQKYIKENRITWPVYFDGKQAKNEFSPKLNVTSVPRLLLFDKNGILQSVIPPGSTTLTTHHLPLNVFDVQVRKLLGLK